AARFSRLGNARAVHHRLAVRAQRLRLAHAVRVRQHPEVRRANVQFAAAWPEIGRLHRRARDEHSRQLRLHAETEALQTDSGKVFASVLSAPSSVGQSSRRVLAYSKNLRNTAMSSLNVCWGKTASSR